MPPALLDFVKLEIVQTCSPARHSLWAVCTKAGVREAFQIQEFHPQGSHLE